MKAAFRAEAVFLAMAMSVVGGQETLGPAPSPPVSSVLADLPLDAQSRSTLQAAIAKHEYESAETVLAQAAAQNPKSQPILLVLANVLFLDGKQLNSALVLKKAELLGPLDEKDRYLLALAYIAIGRKNLAQAELEKLAQMNPSSAVYPYWLSRLLYRKTDLQQALLYARQAVRLDSAFMKGYDQLGLCYAGLNQPDQAIEAYRTAIRLNREQSLKWPWPAMNLGTLYLRLERLDEAEAALRESLAVEPHFPVAHLRMGRVLESEGHIDQAIEELKEAARFDPTYPEPHYALARIYKKRGDESSARAELSLFETLRKTDKQKGITRPD